jgi:phosphate transport system permease protein
MAGVRPTDPLSRGGVLHALIGTVLQVGIAILIALPLGVATAVYMTEENSALSRIVRTVVEAMTALADIIAGLFVYTVLIVALGTQRDGLAAAIALSVTMLPIIARSGFVVLSLVPGGLREAGLALGASRWETVKRVVLPTARAGLATSLILGIARIAGETAPLLIVSGASTFTNANPINDPMNSLPLYIYVAVRSGQPTYIARGFGAASLLLALVLVLFVVARFLARNRGTRR